MSRENEKTNEWIQSILTTIKEIMSENSKGIPDQIQSQVNSELRAIDSQLDGIVDLIKEEE